MKKLVISIIAIALVLGLSHTIFAAPDFVTVDAYLYSRSDPAYGPFDPNVNTLNCDTVSIIETSPYACSMFFEAGIYRISVDSGAWRSQSFGGVNYGTDPINHPWLWSMNIYQDATHNFLLGDNTAPQLTADQALSANAGKSVLITQPADGNIWFFIDDPDSPRDNGFGTSVTASVVLVPEPVSSSLFVLGGAVFGVRRYWQKRRRG